MNAIELIKQWTESDGECDPYLFGMNAIVELRRLHAENERAIRALQSAGYTLADGAAEWRPPPAIPEGYKLVPIEPTVKMLDACLVNGATEAQRKVKNVYADIWAKMLTASEQIK